MQAIGDPIHPTDEAYVRRAGSGDAASFTALVVRYWGAVHGMARSMLPEASEADEVTEETFLALLRSAEPLPADLPFRTALYRVAMERSLCRLRASPEAGSGTPPDLLPAFDPAGAWAAAPRDWSGLAEALIGRRDLAARLREGLGRLGALDRASFILREIEQLATGEVAEILRTSPEEIRARTHRARRHAGRLALARRSLPT